MNDTDIIQKLSVVIEEKKGTDGWTDLALIGKPLMEKGINYKALGYLKLNVFLKEYEEFFEIKKDTTTHKIPVVYVRQRDSKLSSIEGKKIKVQKIVQ